MAFSGVRSSWDMFARNCDLCWLPRQARFGFLERWNSRAFSMASADWWRTSGAGRPPRAGTRRTSARITSSPRTRRPRAAADDGEHRAMPGCEQQVAEVAKPPLEPSIRRLDGAPGSRPPDDALARRVGELHLARGAASVVGRSGGWRAEDAAPRRRTRRSMPPSAPESGRRWPRWSSGPLEVER